MKNNIDNINKIVEDINVYIDKLLCEQVDDNDTASTQFDKIISRDKGEVTIDDRSKQLGTDLQTGKVSWESVFTPQELEKFDEWEKTAAAGAGYTITFGKYAGKVLAAPAVGAYKLYQVVSGKKKVKLNPFPKKIDPDICNCVEFVKKYTSLSGECESTIVGITDIQACRKNFMDGLESDLINFGQHEKKLALEYADDCENLHYSVIYDKKLRVHTDFTVGCKTFGNMLDDAEEVASELGSLLGKYFRIKNQKDPNKNKKGGSVSEKLVMYGEIIIDFSSIVGPPANSSPLFTSCLSHGVTMNNSHSFEVMSASNKNEGKTVELRHKSSGMYCLITFDNSQKGRANAGTVRWVNNSTKTAMCPDYPWKGRITDLKT